MNNNKMKNVYLNNEGKRTIISLNIDNQYNINQIDYSLNHINNKRNIQLISNSQFPSDFFSSKKDPQTHNTQIDTYLKHNEDVDHCKTLSNTKIHIIPKQRSYAGEEPKTQFNEKDIISFKYDNNYEEDKEMIDLLSGKANMKTELNTKNSAALIQTLRQKRKTLKKCEIIPEVNESQYMRTRTSQFSTEENEHNMNNIRHKQYLTKSKGEISKLNYNNKNNDESCSKASIPMPNASKQRNKIAIDATQRDSSATHCKSVFHPEIVIKEPQSTRSNSSTLRNLNKNNLLTMNSKETDSCLYDKQIGPLQSTFNSIMTLVNDKDLKEDDTIKQKLKLIMQNISDIKTAIAHKKHKRNNIASAPSKTATNTPSLTKTNRNSKLKLTNNDMPYIIRTLNPKSKIEDHVGHYSNYRNNLKKGIVTQRRNQSTAPVKVFSQSKK